MLKLSIGYEIILYKNKWNVIIFLCNFAVLKILRNFINKTYKTTIIGIHGIITNSNFKKFELIKTYAKTFTANDYKKTK